MSKKVGRRILVVAAGGVKHLAPFVRAGRKEGVRVTVGSFSDLKYLIDSKGGLQLTIKGHQISSFDVVYIRLAGKRSEDAALLVHWASLWGVGVVDRLWQRKFLTHLPLAKSLELALLARSGVPVPPTLFATLEVIKKRAPVLWGFPFVIKDTQGRQAKAVWLARNKRQLGRLCKDLQVCEGEGSRFIAEPFIRAAQRNRIFVIGGRVVGGITRPARWRKLFVKDVKGQTPAGIKAVLSPVPGEDAALARRAAAVLGVDVAGVDIIRDEQAKAYVLEVNPAPRWHLVKKEVGVDVEREIIKFLAKLARRR